MANQSVAKRKKRGLTIFMQAAMTRYFHSRNSKTTEICSSVPKAEMMEVASQCLRMVACCFIPMRKGTSILPRASLVRSHLWGFHFSSIHLPDTSPLNTLTLKVSFNIRTWDRIRANTNKYSRLLPIGQHCCRGRCCSLTLLQNSDPVENDSSSPVFVAAWKPRCTLHHAARVGREWEPWTHTAFQMCPWATQDRNLEFLWTWNKLTLCIWFFSHSIKIFHVEYLWLKLKWHSVFLGDFSKLSD